MAQENGGGGCRICIILKEFRVARKKNDERKREREERGRGRGRLKEGGRRSRETTRKKGEDDDKEEGQTCRDKTGDAARGMGIPPEKSNPHSSGL